MSTRSVGKPSLDQSRMEPRQVAVARDKPRLNDTRKVKPRPVGEPSLGNRPTGGKQKELKKPGLNTDYMQKREVPVQKMIEAELAEFSLRDMFRGKTNRAMPVRGDAIAYHYSPQGITVAHVRDGYVVDQQLVASKDMAKQQAKQAKQAWFQAHADLLNLRTNQRNLARQKATEYAQRLNLPPNTRIGEYEREIPVFGFQRNQPQARYTSPNPSSGFSNGSVPNSGSQGASPQSGPDGGRPSGGPWSGPPRPGAGPTRPRSGPGGGPIPVGPSGFEPAAPPSRSYPNAAPLRNPREVWRNKVGSSGRPAPSNGNIASALGGIGRAATDNLYSGLFDALQQGKDTFAGVKDPILPKARPYFDKGMISNPNDLRRLVAAKFDPVAAGLSASPGTQPIPQAWRQKKADLRGPRADMPIMPGNPITSPKVRMGPASPEPAPENPAAVGPNIMSHIPMAAVDNILRQAHLAGADRTRKNPNGYWTDNMIKGQGELTKRHAALKFIEKSKANTSRVSESKLDEWGWPRQQSPALSPDQVRAVIQQARTYGVRCRYNNGQFMVNYPAGGSNSAFTTSNPEQAIAMAKRMSHLMDIHASRMQEGYPDTTYERDEPAHEARLGNLQLRGRMTDPGVPDANREFMQARDLHIERIHEVAQQEIDHLLRLTAKKLGFGNIVIEEEESEVTPSSANTNVELPRVRLRWVGEGGHLPQPKRSLPSNIAGTGKDFRAKPGTNRAKKQPGPLVGSGKAMKAKPGFVG